MPTEKGEPELLIVLFIPKGKDAPELLIILFISKEECAPELLIVLFIPKEKDAPELLVVLFIPKEKDAPELLVVLFILKQKQIRDDQQDDLVDPESVDEYERTERALWFALASSRCIIVAIHVAFVEVPIRTFPQTGDLGYGCWRLHPV